MPIVRLATTITLALAINTSAAAISISLDFNTLPSAQGWTYNSNGPAEADVFSVTGTRLVQNTLGTGFTYAEYAMPGVVDPETAFLMTVRARVIASQEVPNPVGTSPATAFIAYLYTGTEGFGVGLNMNAIHAPFGSGLITPLDTTLFHDYRIEGTPGVSTRIFVDGVLLAHQLPPLNSAANTLGLGNGSGFEKGHVEITEFSFRQPIPEPGSSLLMLAGLAVIIASRVRRLRKDA